MSTHQIVAITGATGYVGSVIAKSLAADATVLRLVRAPQTAEDQQWSFDSPVNEIADMLRSRGVTCLIHAAWDMRANNLSELKKSCVAGSERLMVAAHQAGIKNIIFISTISAFDGARSAYGQSKLLVEKQFLNNNETVLRLGLVYGSGDGGVFGNLRRTLNTARIVPMIGNGQAPQYLLDEDSLGEVIQRAVRGEFSGQLAPITIANPQPIPFRDLLNSLAPPNKKPYLIPIPWMLLYSGLKFAELCKLKLSFRSDSVLSFVFQNKNPDFRLQHALGLATKEFNFPHD
jgi:nucleoside-diphosphate-sugar epimerase